MAGEIALPPHDIDAEEAVIASLLVDGEAISEVASELKPDHFYRETHRWVYKACLELYESGEAINQITVAYRLGQQDKLEAIGGAAYLSHLVTNMPTSVYLKSYANVVLNTAFRRKVIEASHQIAEKASSDGADTSEVLSASMGMLLELRPPGRRTLVRPRERAEQALTVLCQRRDGQSESLPFGFIGLDKETGGMAKGDLVLVGARPEIGKSTLVQQIGNRLAESGYVVLLCSAEMSVMQYTDRELAAKTGLPIFQINKALLDDGAWEKVQNGVAQIAELPLYYLGGMALTTAEIEAKAKEVQLEGRLDLVIVDYVQLLADSKGGTENERVSGISHHLKQLAVDLEVPVLAVSQLSRNLENREDKRPKLADLRDSGSLEQDADVVLLLYRDDAYFDDETWLDSRAGRRGRQFGRGMLEILIAKHRQYGSDNRIVKLVWDPQKRQYRDHAEEDRR